MSAFSLALDVWLPSQMRSLPAAQDGTLSNSSLSPTRLYAACTLFAAKSASSATALTFQYARLSALTHFLQYLMPACTAFANRVSHAQTLHVLGLYRSLAHFAHRCMLEVPGTHALDSQQSKFSDNCNKWQSTWQAVKLIWSCWGQHANFACVLSYSIRQPSCKCQSNNCVQLSAVIYPDSY